MSKKLFYDKRKWSRYFSITVWKLILSQLSLYCFYYHHHCVKSVQIRSYFWSPLSFIQSECRKTRTGNNSLFGQFSCSAYLHIDLEALRKLNPLMHNVPKWSEKWSQKSYTASAARFLKWVSPFWNIMH